MTIDSIGDIEQTVQEVANLSRTLERQVRINLTAIDLQKSDFAGVNIHKGKFKASPLRGSDFAGATMDKLLHAAWLLCLLVCILHLGRIHL